MITPDDNARSVMITPAVSSLSFVVVVMRAEADTKEIFFLTFYVVSDSVVLFSVGDVGFVLAWWALTFYHGSFCANSESIKFANPRNFDQSLYDMVKL